MQREKLLYIGGVFRGSTGLERYNELKEIFHVDLINTDPYFKSRSYTKKILNEISPKLFSNVVSKKVIKELSNGIKYKFGMVSKCYILSPKVIAKLKEKCDYLIHYTPDPAFYFYNEPNFVSSLSLYDLCVTTKKWEVDLYKKNGAQNVIWVPQSINTMKFQRLAQKAKERNLVFIGRKEEHYNELISAILKNSLDPGLNVFGDQWTKDFGGESNIFHPGVWDSEYIKILSGTKIGLGFLSKLFPEHSTTRSIEIPAAGTFLLAERTDEHLEMYMEGVEADFFSDKEEMLDKIKYYLKYEEKRERIAVKGHLKSKNFDNTIILKTIFKQFNEDL